MKHETGGEETAVIVEDWVCFELSDGRFQWGACGRCLLPSDRCELDQDCGGIGEGHFREGEAGKGGSLDCIGVLGKKGWVEAHRYNNVISCRQIRV